MPCALLLVKPLSRISGGPGHSHSPLAGRQLPCMGCEWAWGSYRPGPHHFTWLCRCTGAGANQGE